MTQNPATQHAPSPNPGILGRPTVLLSSTIQELRDLRAEVAAAIEERSLATEWRFETHAVAAGDPPDAQYLEMARHCDLYIVIVGGMRSSATEQEYDEAFADNPEKILAFFVGSDNEETIGFRRLLMDRHTIVRKYSAATLSVPIVDAVAGWVLEGRACRVSLRREIERRLANAQRGSAELPLSFIPHVGALGAPQSVVDRIGGYLRPGRSVAMTGIGGAGKTFGALVGLELAGRSPRALPVYLRAKRELTDFTRAVVAAFDAVRFSAHKELVEEWARRGNLVVVLDGLEVLSASERRELLESVSSFSERFPRSCYVVCARQLASQEVSDFVRIVARPLDDQQLSDVFHAIGVATTPAPSFGDQVVDLARWPFWTGALLAAGATADTGLELLQDVVTRRLDAAAFPAGVERASVRAAAGLLAYQLWPRDEATPEEAISALVAGATTSPIRERFSLPAAADVLELLGRAGLLDTGPGVSFSHRLIATILAAEHAALVKPLSEKAQEDPELRSFVAALLGEDRQLEMLELAERDGVLGIARILRLIPARDRSADDRRDADRFINGLAALGTQGSMLMLFGEAWTAWARAATADVRSPASDEDFHELQASGDPAATLIRGQSFAKYTPERWALIEKLRRWKDRFVALDPRGDPSGIDRISEHSLRKLMRGRGEFDERVIDAVLGWRQQYRRIRDSVGLADVTELDPGQGDPRISVFDVGVRQEVRVEIVWDAPSATVELVRDGGGWRGQSLSYLLSVDAAVHAYRDLRRQVESLLGCLLTSEAWRSPELVAAWSW